MRITVNPPTHRLTMLAPIRVAAVGTIQSLRESDLGVRVQPYHDNLTTWQGKAAPEGVVVGTTDAQTITNKTIDGSPAVTTYSLTLTALAGAGSPVLLTSPRLAADFGLLMVYPSAGVNVGAAFYVSPKGTGTPTSKSQISVFNTDYAVDQTNSEFVVLRAMGASGYALASGRTGTGQNRNLMIATGYATDGTTNAGQLWLGTTGNVGIAVGGAGIVNHKLTLGAQAAAPIGSTAEFAIYGASAPYMIVRDTTNNIEAICGVFTGYGARLGSVTNHPATITTNNIPRFRITADGRLLYGATLPTDDGVTTAQFAGNIKATRVQLTTAAEPTANATNRGTIAYVAGGAGVYDTIRVIVKDSADGYAWRDIAGLDLLNNTEPTKGAALVGYSAVSGPSGGTIAERLTSPATIDMTPITLASQPLHAKGLMPSEKAGPAFGGTVHQVEQPLHFGTRRNLWRFTEDISGTSYVTTLMTKQADTIVRDGITLTRVSSANFNAFIRSNIAGLGLTPFVTGELYMMSCYVLNRNSAEQYAWMRGIVNSSSPGHGAKLLTNRVRRIWHVCKAISSTYVSTISTATVPIGTEAINDPIWLMQGAYITGPLEVYIGGFQIEKLPSNTYKDGIAMIGDSTMAGASGGLDFGVSYVVSKVLGALLNVNVFNRAIGGQTSEAMDLRWATDITPLAVNCKYVIIQAIVNDIGSADRPVVDIQANIASMVAKAIADGMIPVLFTCTPATSIASSPAKEAKRQTMNAWLLDTYPNVIDIAAAVQDPYKIDQLRNGTAQWYGDGVHYGPAAMRAIAIYASLWSGWDFIRPSPYQAILASTFTPSGGIFGNDVQVLGHRNTGWTAGTGTPSKGTFAADTATPLQTAQRVLAIEQALRGHGSID